MVRKSGWRENRRCIEVREGRERECVELEGSQLVDLVEMEEERERLDGLEEEIHLMEEEIVKRMTINGYMLIPHEVIRERDSFTKIDYSFRHCISQLR